VQRLGFVVSAVVWVYGLAEKIKALKINKTFNISQNRKMYSLTKNSCLYEFKKKKEKREQSCQ
jgi:hypothetical protein